MTALRQQVLTDLQSAAFNTGGSALLPNSILRILGVAEAGMVYELYGYLDWIALQCTPYTATGEYMEGWANLKGIYREPASPATGSASFTGSSGADIPAGSLITRADGITYATAADWQVGNIAPLSFSAVVPGSIGNAANGIPLTLSPPVPGVNSAGVAASAITGGADLETDASLQSRMLSAYATPPDGGSASFYVNAALSVPGVTRAWVVSQGVSAGSVLLFIMLDTANSATFGFPVGSNGGASTETRVVAATGDQLRVANAVLAAGQPVTSVCYVAAPVATPVAFSIQSLSLSNAQTQANIQQALGDMFLRLAAPLATNVIYPSDVNAAIESAAGVGRYVLSSPVTPINTTNGFLPTLGPVTFS